MQIEVAGQNTFRLVFLSFKEKDGTYSSSDFYISNEYLNEIFRTNPQDLELRLQYFKSIIQEPEDWPDLSNLKLLEVKFDNGEGSIEFWQLEM